MTEKEKKRRNTVYLPEDLLVEILSRVPEASLARLRSTSKVWNALIKKDARLDNKSLVVMLIDCRVYLATLDLQDDNVVKVISQFRLSDPLSNSWEDVNVRRVYHCDGLLLCTTMDERLVVWNLCSGETSRVIKPLNSNYMFDTYALGKSSCNNEYKILRVHHRRHGLWQPYLVKYEIYDFTSNSWRVVGETRDGFIPFFWRGGTYVDGNTYWLYRDNQEFPRGMNTLRCFDFSTERFGVVSLPGDTLSYDDCTLSVTREEQKLCLLTSRAAILHDIDVWMATKVESTGDLSWSKLLTVKRTHEYQFITLGKGMSFLADRENKVIVHPIKDINSSNLLLIVGEDKYIKVNLHDVGSKYPLPLSCDPALVQIQHGSLGLGMESPDHRVLKMFDKLKFKSPAL